MSIVLYWSLQATHILLLIVETVILTLEVKTNMLAKDNAMTAIVAVTLVTCILHLGARMYYLMDSNLVQTLLHNSTASLLFLMNNMTAIQRFSAFCAVLKVKRVWIIVLQVMSSTLFLAAMAGSLSIYILPWDDMKWVYTVLMALSALWSATLDTVLSVKMLLVTLRVFTPSTIQKSTVVSGPALSTAPRQSSQGPPLPSRWKLILFFVILAVTDIAGIAGFAIGAVLQFNDVYWIVNTAANIILILHVTAGVVFWRIFYEILKRRVVATQTTAAG